MSLPQYKTSLYESDVIDNPYTPDHTLLKFTYSENSHVVSPTGIWEARAKEIAESGNVKNQKEKAKKLILRFLVSYKDEWMPGTELLSAVMEAGISERTITQARAELVENGEIERKRLDGGKFVAWRIKFNIPDAPPDDGKDA